MNHYFKLSLHIALGVFIVIAALILWRGSAWAPEDIHDVPPMATSLTDANIAIMKNGAAVPVITEAATYFPDRNGFYARPEAPGTYPGIVMIHEWWGLNDTMRETAKELAGQGYQVLAVDMFGTVATTQDEARKQTGSFDKEKGRENMRAATAYLRAKGATKIASLGWCFGGGQSLQLALSGEQLNATVIYYGNVTVTKDELRAITWPVLGNFAGEDQGIPPKAVNAFRDTLNELGIQNDIVIYPGVGHAFANPSGQSYAPNETKDAWQRTLKFLQSNLK
ncbi:MAG: Dienelactone hydrolase [Candidatus Wolfebacteria bacterium GW2011_GWC2_39_22]|uniref:Dienelactone hydrolase n=1 Tax=Candidatus Wolfebacteria bacterium GW2011_GWC2_39_22 TaxID=1619013 RepID=A0A0G0NJ26_9BACT|nr:MAG: Dienelactone hydrolase [Candidatus Wolfebacteria bacterium GW2011_GWC2_39_22]HBI25497.1 carboxymethylenebutenolidase [Candidatus Wolfebacteria bacterium]